MIEIKNKKNCCGCSACYSICPKNCIEMKADEEGFLYPNVNKDLCIDCGLCEKVCPIINKAEEKVFEPDHGKHLNRRNYHEKTCSLPG